MVLSPVIELNKNDHGAGAFPRLLNKKAVGFMPTALIALFS